MDIDLSPYEVYTTTVKPTNKVDFLVYLSKHSLLDQQLPPYFLIPYFMYTPTTCTLSSLQNNNLKPK